MHVMMLVANSVRKDPRVTKEASALARAGHKVTVIGISEEGTKGGMERTRERDFDIWLLPGRALNSYRHIVEQMATNKPSRELTGNATGSASSGTRLLARSANAWLLLLLVERAFEGLRGSLAQLKPDAVHAHDFNTLRPATRISLAMGIPAVYDSHEFWSELGDYHPVYKQWLARQEQRTLRISGCRVITVSNSIADLFVERYGIERPIVVWNAPNVKSCWSPAPVHDPLTFLYHGALTSGRGLHILVKAFRYVRSRCRLVIRGDGPERSHLESLVAEYEIRNVTIERPVAMDEVVNYARRDGDIGVIPFDTRLLNNRLALPNKLFEYLAAGLAIFTRELTDVLSLNEKYRFGAVYRGKTAREVAEEIDALVNRMDIMALKRNAVACYRELTWDRAAERLVGLYDSLA